MAFSITGSVTVTDVRDGISAPTVLLSNENHTFVADAEGVIADFDSFSTTVTVFVGETSYTATTGSPNANQFRILSAVGTGDVDTDITVAGVVTLVDDDSPAAGSFQGGDTVNESQVTVTVEINGVTGNIARTVSLSKAIGGSAPIIRVEANTQTVSYDFVNDERDISRTANIVITATELNITESGNVVWTTSLDGAAFGTALANIADQITLSSDDNNNTLTITPAGWEVLIGSGEVLTFRATKGMASDRVSVSVLRDGSPAITVDIVIASGSQFLRTDTSTVDLRADVLFGAETQTPGSDWTYRWRKGTTILTPTNIMSETGNANTGFEDQGLAAASRTITVTGAGITDSESSQFSCEVVDPS